MTVPFRYAFTFSEKELFDLCMRNHMAVPSIPEHANAITTPYPEACLSVVCLLPDDEMTPIEMAALMAHESVHVFDQIMEFMHEENPGREIRAYGTQMILQNFMLEYKKKFL